MYKVRNAALALAGAFALAACGAPAPTTHTVVYAEPVYDKYGTTVPGTDEVCRPRRQPISTAFPARLPICEDLCPRGTVPQLSSVADARQLVCVPVPHDGNGNGDDEPREQPDPQRDPIPQ